MDCELFPTGYNKGDQARRRLLLAAMEKIGEKGYDNASVREIADAAGQNVAAIAYYFGNKEKLYAGVLNGIGEHLQCVFSPVTEKSRAMMSHGSLTPGDGVAIVKSMIRTLLGQQLEGSEFEKIRLVMLREQAKPSENFGLLYESTLKPLHEVFSGALGTATGEDPFSAKLILRAHAIFGQVLAFTLARATLLRRLEIDRLAPSHIETIAGILDEHIDLICGGLPKK